MVMQTSERRNQGRQGEERVMTTSRSEQQVFSLKPNWYMHVLNNNTNVTHLKTGPDTITLQGHEEVVKPPTPMIVVKPRYYCVIRNPVVWKNKDAREPNAAENHFSCILESRLKDPPRGMIYAISMC